MDRVVQQFEDSMFYDREVRVLIEDHLTYLTLQAGILEVKPIYRHRYQGNFYGLLSEITSIPKDAYWLVLRLNRYNDPSEYRSEIDSILIPEMETVYMLLNRHGIKRS